MLRSLFFCYSWFRLSRLRSTVTDGGVDRTPSQRVFSHTCTLSSLFTHHIVAQGFARRVCIKHVHPHVIPCLSVCCFLVLSSSSVSRASLSLSLLPVFCPELQPPCCRERRALNLMRTRKMRSIAPWRYATLSQIPCQEPQKPTKHPGAESCLSRTVYKFNPL